MHSPGGHYRVAGVAAEVQQHAKSRVIDRLADALHRLGLHLGSPMVLWPDLEPGIVGELCIFFVALHNQVKLLFGEGIALPACVDADGLRAQQFRRSDVIQRALIVLLAHRGVIIPNVRSVHTQVRQLQVALLHPFFHLLEKILFDGREKAVPDVCRIEVVAVFATLQVAENIHLAVVQQPMKGIRGNRDLHKVLRG